MVNLYRYIQLILTHVYKIYNKYYIKLSKFIKGRQRRRRVQVIHVQTQELLYERKKRVYNTYSSLRIPLNASEVAYCVLNRILARVRYIIIYKVNRFGGKNKSIRYTRWKLVRRVQDSPLSRSI